MARQQTENLPRMQNQAPARRAVEAAPSIARWTSKSRRRPAASA